MVSAMTWAERLNTIFERTGWSKKELSRRSGVNYGSVVKYLEAAVEQPRGEIIKQLADALGVNALWLEKGITTDITQVRLRGDVGAGQEVLAIDGNDDDMVDAPMGVTDDTSAVRVKGNSMFPAYEEGTLLYYSSNLPPRDMTNRRCVVKLPDGRIFVKFLSPGTDDTVWNLQSINTEVPTMIDVVVEWAAPIDWIKPR